MKLEPGVVVASRFRLLRPLGKGGMGEVWVAHDERLATPCAVKFLLGGLDESARRRFALEARSAAQLRSPNVVQVLDHGETDGVPYIAMELLEGEDLASRLSRVGQLSAAQTLVIVEQVARALGRAHAVGIVHRDLKPANVFLARDDDREVVKVLDFGIAKLYADEAPRSLRATPTQADVSLTATGVALGTPRYMSPEQIDGGDVDLRSDLWALAVVAYECLTGRPPFDSQHLGALYSQVISGPTPRVTSLRHDLPAGADEWLSKALAKDRERRYPTARDLVEALARALGAGEGSRVEPSAAPHAVPMAPPQSWDATVAAPIGERSAPMFEPTVAHPVTPPALRPRSRGWPWAVAVVPVAGLALAYVLLAPPRERATATALPGGSSGSSAAVGSALVVASAPSASASPLEVSLVPFVPGAAKAVEVAVGTSHSCARLSTGAIACWGRGYEGQLGATLMASSPPVSMPGVDDAARVVAGNLSTCVLRARGPARCFGLVAASVEGVPGFLEDVTSIALSPSRGACAVKSGGRVVCTAEIRGQKDGEHALPGVRDARQVVLGHEHGCVLHASGKVSCWGSNNEGQLAGPAGGSSETPREVPGASEVEQLAAGRGFTCGRRKDGSVVCWGNPGHGVLGAKDRRKVKQRVDVFTVVDNPKETRAEPVLGLTEVVDLAAGGVTACALRTGGELVCWGDNQNGMLGRGTSGTVTLEIGDTAPPPERALEGVRQFDVGAYHACAALEGGEVRCWGRGDELQLGSAPNKGCAGGVVCATTPLKVF